MLSNLYIENIAVIEKANIDFTLGFNVLTGETGAGKSIVIDAISAILGGRINKGIIRNGSDMAFVSATFHNVSKLVIKKANSLGISLEDDCLILQREFSIAGKNTCRINSRPATLTALKELGVYLIGIHGQNDNMELISPSLHMHYIDSLANFKELMKEYREKYKSLKEIENELDTYTLDENKRIEDIDLLIYQINEIEESNIEVGEEEKLKEEKAIINNLEKITNLLYKSQILLDGDGNEYSGIISSLDDVCSSMIDASKNMDSLNALSDKVSNAYYLLEECSSEIENAISDIGIMPERINEVEERLDVIYKLCKKYGPSEEDVLNFLENAKQEKEKLENYSSNLESLRNEYNLKLSQTTKIAQELSNIRKKTAEVFTEKVQKEMAFLEMPNVKLVVDQQKDELGPRGFDKIEFLISVNPGEEPKPVAKIASGGELSRMMLAIKTVLSEHDIIDTLIFDEIDTGISGSAAERVGQKLQQVSVDKQVICVTHQAQIAALADNHLLITKDFVDDRTYTKINKLDYDGRVKELARIIDGVEVTSTAIEHAKQLITYKEG